MLQEFGRDIWIVDGPDVRFAGIHMPTRMTVARLKTGGLWVHSPIKFSAELNASISRLGTVEVLVAPNKFHHLYLADWMSTWPKAQAFATEQLVSKKAQIKFTGQLSEVAPKIYTSDIAQTIFRGNRVFEEAVFFHRASQTLIMTDLLLNVHTDQQSWISRVYAKFDQVAFPNGGVPRMLRASMKNRAIAKNAVRQMLAWNPKKLVFCHGELFSGNGVEVILEKFGWLLDDEK